MMMSEGEIRSSYRMAKNPREQIKILAQLNDVKADVIRDIIDGVYKESVKPSLSSGYKKVEVDHRRRYTVIRSSEFETIVNMWAAGAPVKRIAEVLGRTCGEIRRFLDAHRDICPERTTRTTTAVRSEILRLFDAGMKVSHIAKTLGIGYSRAQYTIYKERGDLKK